jgi:2-keto-4-pentenoate hydratase/2-oxohepta-3-ene-1,7-dioic acid hydratase in catechol pathway
MGRLRELAGRAAEDPELRRRHGLAPDEVRWLAPVPRPGKILCLGRNYAAHAAESGGSVPDWPCIFSKPASAVIGHEQRIRIPEVSEQVDYEVELAVVIGRAARHVSQEDAYDYVAGYTVLNDVSVRDYQKEKGGGQWTLGKSFDTACPIGPWLVTSDEIPDPHDLGIRCEVNGEKLQLARTSQMFFKIPFIIEHVTACLTLEPGDVIATGTPAGVGMARKPPRWLQPGDVVECTVERIGTLRNPVE